MNLNDAADSHDRRQATRYPIELPVELENGMGITCNVSTGGVLFRTDRQFAAGDEIRFRLIVDAANPLYCQGQVLRAERCREQWSIAVRIASFQFKPN